MLECGNDLSVRKPPETDIVVVGYRSDGCTSRIDDNGTDRASVTGAGLTDLRLGCCIPFAYGKIEISAASEKASAIGRPRE